MKTMNQKTFASVVGMIFLVIAVFHLVRAVLGWNAVIGSFAIPMWVSWVAIVISAFLAYTAFSLSR